MNRILCGVLALCCAVLLLGPMAAFANDCWYYEQYGDHDWEMVDVGGATCTTDGFYLNECRQCGQNDRHITEKAYGHSYTSYITTEEPTCAYEGTRTRSCTVCDWQEFVGIPKKDHTFGNWKVITATTDHSTGERARTCKGCGEVERETTYSAGTLYRGMTGSRNDVIQLQQMLTDLGYLDDKIDGVFGAKTEAAVRAYQKWSGIKQSGIAFPQTRGSLSTTWAEWKDNQAQEALPDLPEATNPPMEEALPYCRMMREQDQPTWSICQRHELLRAQEELLLSAAQTDAARLRAQKTIRGLWQSELEDLYLEWIEALPEADRPQAIGNQPLFLAYLKNQEMLWPEAVRDERAAEMLREQCFVLCEQLDALHALEVAAE